VRRQLTHPGAAALAVAVSLTGCGAGVEQRIAKINEALSRDERRAALLRGDTLKLQTHLAIQRRCLGIAECRATSAAVNADRLAALGNCNLEAANWAACDAERAKDTATSAGLGCLFGWAAAIVTGGAAAPAVVIGCGVGAAAGHGSAEGSCVDAERPRDCGTRDAEFVSQALAKHGLRETPQCQDDPPECALLGSGLRQ
jgi:hypothetical protein